MYPNLLDFKAFGYALNKKKSKINFERMFTNQITGQMINYKVDDDFFLKPLIDYNNQKYILKFFGGSTSFCNRVNQEEFFIDKGLSQIASQKDFYYKTYAIPGHNILHDYCKIKNFKLESNLNKKSIFVFNHGWNEEFSNSAHSSDLYEGKAFSRIENNYIYRKSFILSKMCKHSSFLSPLIKKYTQKRFNKIMNLYGTERWKNFINNNHLNFWLHYLEKIFKLIENKKSIIINNPGLAHLSDTKQDVDLVVEKTRLNQKYHLYQSLCLEINSIINNNIANFFEIPLIDCNLEFKKMSSQKRLEYFVDEIHLSKKGHHLLADIFKKKFFNLDLNKVNKIKKKDFNVLKIKILKEIDFLINIAKCEMYKNYSISKKLYYIPRDRYPTYNTK